MSMFIQLLIKRALVLSLFFSFLIAQEAHAYRPFVSDDAAVGEKGSWTAEIGLFTIANEVGQNEITTPSLDISYGIWNRFEVSAAADIQVYKDGEDRNGEFKDPQLEIKGVLKEGVLQEQEGWSVSLATTLLLPSTVKGERDVGFGFNGVISGQLFEFTYHLNSGFELERSAHEPVFTWGVILETPDWKGLRIVGEIEGSATRNDFPNNTALGGVIWELPWFDWDFGSRVGLNDAANDWELTTGITVTI